MSSQSVKSNLRRIKTATPQAMRSKVATACIGIVAKAKANCTPETTPYFRAPLKTGNLRRNNEYVAELNPTSKRCVGVVYNNTEYALFVHDGTSRMQARPFLWDAVVACMPETEELVRGIPMESFRAVR